MASTRLSLWKNGKHSNDFKFFDRRISEVFTISGTGCFIHKYLGPAPNPGSTDPTQPANSTESATDIQDLLFGENRDRVYDPDVYVTRCQYQVTDSDFDLSQFGIFLQNGTIFISFHLIDVVNLLGRKPMPGDVLELPHLKEFYSLDEDVSVALGRYYVIQDAVYSSEGYSPSWWPHIWRVKCNPLTDSQEYSQIINQIVGTAGGNAATVGNLTSTYGSSITLNDAVIADAEITVPLSGYDTSELYSPLFKDGIKSHGTLEPGSSPEQVWAGYLVGNGSPIDGYPVTAGQTFPDSTTNGEYFLRTDYLPNRLFRFNGTNWIKAGSNVRTGLTPGNGMTQRDTFTNNLKTFVNSTGNVEMSRQGLSQVLNPGK